MPDFEASGQQGDTAPSPQGTPAPSPRDDSDLEAELAGLQEKMRAMLGKVPVLEAEMQRLQALCHRLEGTIRVLQMVGVSLDLAEVIGHFEHEARHLASFDRLVLLLLDEEDPARVRLVSLDESGALKQERIDRQAVKAMQVIGQWRPMRRQLWPGEFSAPDDSAAFAAGVRTLLEVPLSLPDAPLGVASFGSFEDDAFSSEEIVVLGALGASLGQAVGNCLVVEALRASNQTLLARQGQPGITEGTTPDAVREFLADHLHQEDSWFFGLTQGLLLSGALDSYQIERLEEWWSEHKEA